MTAVAEPGIEERELPTARAALTDAIADLVDPVMQTLISEEGEITTTWIDPLYAQLRDAIGGVQGKPSDSAKYLPIWAAALDQAKTIDSQVGKWEPHWPVMIMDGQLVDEFPTMLRLRCINARRWRPQDTPLIDAIVKQIEVWAEQIRILIAQEPVAYLQAAGTSRQPASCPVCNEASILRRDPDTGETTRTWALQATKLGVVCQNPKCGAAWEPAKCGLLAKMLGYPLPAGVLE